MSKSHYTTTTNQRGSSTLNRNRVFPQKSLGSIKNQKRLLSSSFNSKKGAHSQPTGKGHTFQKRKAINVFTYGYCSNAGKRGGRAAMGIFAELSVSALPSPVIVRRKILTPMWEKQTSEVAALLAVEKAIDIRALAKNPLSPYLQLDKNGRDRDNNKSRVIVILHVSSSHLKELLTTKGDALEDAGYPPCPNIDVIRRVHTKLKPLRDNMVVAIAVSQTNPDTTESPDMVSAPKSAPSYRTLKMRAARLLAKSAVRIAKSSKSKEFDLYKLNNSDGGNVFDDGPRVELNVPPHEYEYAFQKGARWDDETNVFYLYNHDLGVHYDMRKVDAINLKLLYAE